MDRNNELLRFYINRGLVKEEEAQDILSESRNLGINVRDYLHIKEYVTDTSELEALADYYRMPCIELDMLDIDPTLFELFGFEFMKKHKIIPVKYDELGVLIIATGKPLDSFAMSAISTQFSGKFDFILVPPVQIDRYVDSVSAAISTSLALSDLDNESSQREEEGWRNDAVSEGDVINNPAVRLVDSIIKEAIPYGASDIHIEPFEKKVKVRYRIDGDLQNRAEFGIEAYSAICARLKIMSNINIAERRVPQDGRMNMIIGGNEYDFRVSTLPTVFGEKFVIRVLDKNSFRYTRTSLGFTKEENAIVDKMLARPHGIVLLTGPTGCGKSTTLYSFLKEVNDPKVNIVTVEDPVEFTVPNINQTQVNTKANMTFAAALRSILRQDPDIIMIGEIRDEETAEIAVRSAITGHIVFSTLHTNDAPGAILRLEDMGIADYLVADALVGVIAQRLVKRLCPACKQEGETNAAETKMLGLSSPAKISRPKGCQYCNNTGYKGRVAVHEVMYMNEELKNTVLKEKSLEVLRKKAIECGMNPLWDSCKRLVLDGTTSIQELMTLNVN